MVYSLTPAFGKLRQENQKFEFRLVNMVRPYLIKKEEEEK